MVVAEPGSQPLVLGGPCSSPLAGLTRSVCCKHITNKTFSNLTRRQQLPGSHQVQQCLIYAAGILLGKAFDSYGPTGLLIFGGLAQVFGLMMTSISKEYYQIFLAQAICSAIGASAIVYGTLGAMATWWKVKRATAYGIATSGSSMGGVIFPVMVNRLIPRVGFGWTIRALAFIILFGAIVSIATIRSNRAHAPSPFNMQAYITPLADKRFALLCVSMTLFGFGLFLPFNFIPSAAQYLGMSSDLSIYAIAILNAVSVFGRVLPGISCRPLRPLQYDDDLHTRLRHSGFGTLAARNEQRSDPHLCRILWLLFRLLRLSDSCSGRRGFSPGRGWAPYWYSLLFHLHWCAYRKSDCGCFSAS